MTAASTLVSRVLRLAAAAGLCAFVCALYGGSLRYGLMWDDPQWLAAVSRLSPSEHALGLPNYQFYRPLTTLYYAFWVRADGTVNPVLMHAAQIALHATCTLLVWRIARALGSSRGVAYMAAILFAAFPFSQQAAAWAGAHQPLGTAALLFAVWCYVTAHTHSRRARPSARPAVKSGHQRPRKSSLLTWIALGAYTAALLFQETAVPLAVFFPLAAWGLATHDARHGSATDRASRSTPTPRSAWAFPGLAGVFTIVWLTRPRLEGVVGSGLDPEVLRYLIQAAFYPIAMLAARPELTVLTAAGALVGMTLVARPGLDSRTSVLSAVAEVAVGRPGLALAWTALALAPIWLRLGADYVLIGPRLVYPAAFGIVWLWAQLFGAIADGRRRWQRVVGPALAAAVVMASTHAVLRLNRLQAEGAALVQAAADTLAGGGSRPGTDVFVNFPDRLWLDPAPFPVGKWGALVAPIDTDLTDLARLTQPLARNSESRSFPSLGHGVRATAPAHIDMRGVRAQPGELAGASPGTRLWLTEYHRPLRLRLTPLGHQSDRQKSSAVAGAATAQAPDSGSGALFGDRAHLTGATLVATGLPDRPVRLDTAWHVVRHSAQDETVFVHVLDGGGRRVASADGDWWRGTVPLAVRAPGDRFVDSRYPAAVSAIPDWGLRVAPQPSVHEQVRDLLRDQWLVNAHDVETAHYPGELGGPGTVEVEGWPGLNPGRYRVAIGLYNRLSGDRTEVTGTGIPVDSDGRLVVGWVRVLE